MIARDVVVVGGGPAGLSAAIEAKRAGLSVEVIEQRNSLGGAIYRQAIDGISPIAQAAGAKVRWKALSQAFAALRIPVRSESVFLGVEANGMAIVEDRRNGHVLCFLPRAIVLATGAIEHIHPRPGWDLAGVSTAGGLQVMMKETGQAPRGRVLLAGNGPLTIAVAAQMANLGNPPVAVVEAGDPLRQYRAGMQLLRYAGLLREAGTYLGQVYRRGVPWLRAARLIEIQRKDGGLSALLEDTKGARRRLHVDRIGLHDGIRPNNFGLPQPATEPKSAPLIVHAGDCREALGALAAEADGIRAGRLVAALISGFAPDTKETEAILSRSRDAQAVLANLFADRHCASPLDRLPDETVLCRCEGRTVGDLRLLCSRPDPLTAREVKHNGRFAMGSCQGRFCAANTAALMARMRPDVPPPSPEDLTGRRWPLRPVPIGALACAAAKTHEANDKVRQ